MTMIEKMARAIMKSNFHPDDGAAAEEKWAEWEDSRRLSLRQAKAALEALLEPDEGMVKAGRLYDLFDDEIRAVFTAMMRQALSSAEPTAGKSPGTSQTLKITHELDGSDQVKEIKP